LADDVSMRKCFQLATPVASLIAISFLCNLFSPVPATAETSRHTGAITSTTDDSGRKIYVNAEGSRANRAVPASASGTSTQPRASTSTSLVYWSSKEHRFKPVSTSGAVMRAARSAASEVNTYLDSKANTHLILNRAFSQEDIDAAINDAAARHNVDPSLVRSVVKVESNFNPNAVSRRGAMGLMQLMPSTARSLKVSNPFDPAQNVDAGVRHLRTLLDNYKGDVRLTLAAYNAGSGAVARSAGVPHFRETQNYVRRITDLYDGGTETGSHVIGGVSRDPVHVRRNAEGVLYISNTE
jgi:soluble lytic murein transglycosylase-like protein